MTLTSSLTIDNTLSRVMIRSVAESTDDTCCVGGRRTVTPSSPTRTHTSATAPIDDAATYRFKSSTVAPQVQRPHCGHSSDPTLRANTVNRHMCTRGSDTSHLSSQGPQPPSPALRMPVSAPLDPLRQTEGGFLRPRDDVRGSDWDGSQAGGASVLLGGAGKAPHLIVASIRPTFRARHGGEAVHLQRTRLAPRSFLASFTSHATTVPRRQTRRTCRSSPTSTMSAFLPGARAPTVSSPRIAAP